MKRLKRFSAFCRRGVISSWFFAVFLYCISLAAVVNENQIRFTKAMINLQTNQKYLSAECDVLRMIQAMAACGDLEDGSYETASFSFTLEVQGELLYVKIDEPYEELLVEMADETHLYDYQAYREGIEIMD